MTTNIPSKDVQSPQQRPDDGRIQEPIEYQVLPTDTALTVWWSLPQEATPQRQFAAIIDGVEIARTSKTHYTFEGLTANSEHTIAIQCDPLGSGSYSQLFTTKAATRATKERLDISKEPYNAVGDGKTLNTAAIQRALDDCTMNQQVYIPQGVFLSGALRMHSHTTLYIDHGGVLQGSSKPEDYAPKIWSRFEGVEGECYASLINIGTLDHSSTSYNCTDILIYGPGSILGGGRELAQAIIDVETERLSDTLAALGDAINEFEKPDTLAGRARGRLINISNAQDVTIQNLTVGQAPAWNLHFVYSDHIAVSGCTFVSKGIWNGDGCDPDSSTNCVIFDCVFRTGDDMVAIKSGKNPEGNVINRPSKHIRVFDCTSQFGWGIAIGSEISGGIEDVQVWDCDMSHAAYGLEIKATRKRGGYVRNVTMRNCRTSHILIHQVAYNDDGDGSPVPPKFADMRFEDISIDNKSDGHDIEVRGFPEAGYAVENIEFDRITLNRTAVRKDQVDDYAEVLIRNVKHLTVKHISD